LAFGLNEITVEKNDVAKNNTLKTAQVENNSSIDSQVSKLNGQIDKLTDEKAVEVNKWDKFKYSTKRDQTANRYNNDIKEIRDQIKDLNSRRTLPKDQKAEAKTVLGYSILLGSWTVLWMAFISILGEIIGIFSHIEYRRSTRRIQKQYTVWEDNTPEQPKQDIPPINKPAVDLGLFGEKTLQERLEERRNKRDKSHDAKSNVTLTKSDLKYLEQYKDHMVKSSKTKKNGTVDGTERTAKILKISRDRANMLRQYLIDTQFLRGEGKYTYLNREVE